jgi:hypothetical protein
MVVLLFDRYKSDAIVHLNAGVTGKIDECVVQLLSRRYRGVSAGSSEGDLNRAA